ncbi:CHAT domain-containing protein [Floridanema aerugineum]|uniref:CHAT domain-containing protein n=1 Tax=Floridaenema aerugineum BLCC-F46 TaxID=3153654 RepID=A0ABV4X466_9CYAN
MKKLLIKFLILAILSLVVTVSVAQIIPRMLMAGEAIAFPTNSTFLQTAITWNETGKKQLEQGEAEAALKSWQQAEIAYHKAKDENGVIGSQINQAQALQALGKYQEAEKLLIKIQESLKSQPDSLLKVLAKRNLGDVWRVTGNLIESEKILQESWKIAVSLQSPENANAAQLSLGNTAVAQAKRAESVGEKKQAKEEIKKALNFYQTVLKNNPSPLIKLQAQLNLLYLFSENPESSEVEIWLKIRESLNEIPINHIAVAARINFANSLLKLYQSSNKYTPESKEIYQILETALQQSRNLNNQRLEAYTLGYLGKLYELNQQPLEAIKLTNQALNIAQLEQAWDIAYQWQWQLGRLYNIQGEKAKTIAAYKTAINSLDILRKNLIAINPEGQFSFRDDVEPVYRQLVDLLLQPEPGKKEPSQENLKLAIENIDGLQLAEIQNLLGCTNLAPSVFTNQVVDPKAAIIYPIILDRRLAVILQLPGKDLSYHETLLDRQEIERILKELRTDLTASNRKNEVVINSQKVYQWLIQPFDEILSNNQSIKTLVFVLDGYLRNIPMAVLSDGKNYLMEKYAIAISPRIELFTPKPLSRKLKVFLGGVGEAQNIDGKEFEKIEYFEAELNEIKSNIDPIRDLINNNFTKSNIEKLLASEEFSIIHIKTHGEFSSTPDRTFIVAYNQLLKATDLARLIETNTQSKPREIELLVLSACYTAQGDNRAVLGLAGIAIGAGARSTISSLWIAQDVANTALMARFYEELSKGISRAEALNIAQKALFEQYKSPNVWAPYVLVGNWL